jgi:hypothetical protein
VLHVCPACRARAAAASAAAAPAFGLTRESWSFSMLWDHCFAAFQREWVSLSVAALVTVLLTYAIAFAVGMLGALAGSVAGADGEADPILAVTLAVVQMVVQYAVQGALSLGLMRMALDVLHGEKADLGRLFSQLHKTPGYVLVLTLMLLAVAAVMGVVAGAGYLLHRAGVLGETGLLVGGVVAGLLLMVPIVYFTLPLYFLVPELVLQERPELRQAVRNCYRVADGQRLAMLGITLLGGVLVMGGMMLCCVGMFPALALMTLLMGGLYLTLRRGALPAEPTTL